MSAPTGEQLADYKQTVVTAFAGAVMAFFTTMLGIGITHLLDDDDELKYYYFAIGGSLILRMWVGSALHFAVEHGHPACRDLQRKWLKWDSIWLLAFGFCATLMCYVPKPAPFLLFGALLTAASSLWSIFNWMVNRKSEVDAKWIWWLPIDILHLIIFIVIWRMTPAGGVNDSYPILLLGLSAFSLFALVGDFVVQFLALRTVLK